MRSRLFWKFYMTMASLRRSLKKLLRHAQDLAGYVAEGAGKRIAKLREETRGDIASVKRELKAYVAQELASWAFITRADPSLHRVSADVLDLKRQQKK